jgi:hypothetical protein
MAQDELRDVTPQELAELDAGLAGIEPDAETTLSPQSETPTDIDAKSDDEEPER